MASGWHRKNPVADAERKRQYNSAEHKRLRKAGQREVDAGTAHCWRCGVWLPPGCVWHLGHADEDRSIYRGTECVPCNMGGAARASNGRWQAASNGWHSRSW